MGRKKKREVIVCLFLFTYLFVYFRHGGEALQGVSLHVHSDWVCMSLLCLLPANQRRLHRTCGVRNIHRMDLRIPMYKTHSTSLYSYVDRILKIGNVETLNL